MSAATPSVALIALVLALVGHLRDGAQDTEWAVEFSAFSRQVNDRLSDSAAVCDRVAAAVSQAAEKAPTPPPPPPPPATEPSAECASCPEPTECPVVANFTADSHDVPTTSWWSVLGGALVGVLANLGVQTAVRRVRQFLDQLIPPPDLGQSFTGWADGSTSRSASRLISLAVDGSSL